MKLALAIIYLIGCGISGWGMGYNLALGNNNMVLIYLVINLMLHFLWLTIWRKF